MWAVEAYEHARHRLPDASASGNARPVTGILELAEHYEAFLLDAFGVLNVGATAIPGATEAVAALQDMGKRVLVLTNGATYPAEVSLAKYRRWGFDFAPEDVVSSRDALKTGLQECLDRQWGVMAVEGSRLEELSISAHLLTDDPETYRRSEGFILLGSGDWSEKRQAMLLEALRDAPRPVMVGNPDIVAPREDGFSAEPGHYAHDAADKVGAAPVFFGKPFPNIFDLALSRVPGVPPSRVLMVGDTLHTDVLGGAQAGCATLLTTGHGLFRGMQVAPVIARTGLSPDWICASI